MHDKKFWIEVTIIGVIGIIMMVAGIAMGGGNAQLRKQFKLDPSDNEMLAISDAETSEIKHLVINTSGSKVTVRNGDYYKVASDDVCEQFIKGDTLYVGYSDENSYYVDLPTGKFKVASAKMAGRGNIGITIPYGTHFDSVEINGENAKVKVMTIDTAKIECHMKGGSLTVDEIVAESAKIDGKRCDVNIGKGNITNGCSINVPYASISVGKAGADINNIGNLNIANSWGNVTVFATLVGENSIETAHGKVDLTLNGAKEDYAISGNNYSNGVATAVSTKAMLKIISGRNKVNVKYK
ncbi:MAG: DUF4097 domain-containing protein [Lachnospiraceae bacterium]|nr:DUF4097 domain-containing protein [Lachnospiraceae bacterium]